MESVLHLQEFSGKSQLEQHILGAHGLAQVGLSESPFLVMKTKSAFCLVTTPLTRISRQVCKGILDICRSARRPFHPINIALIKQECKSKNVIWANSLHSFILSFCVMHHQHIFSMHSLPSCQNETAFKSGKVVARRRKLWGEAQAHAPIMEKHLCFQLFPPFSPQYFGLPLPKYFWQIYSSVVARRTCRFCLGLFSVHGSTSEKEQCYIACVHVILNFWRMFWN